MKMAIVAVAFLAFTTASAAAEESVPGWVKNTAGWWAEGLTSDAEFIGAMQYLIQEGVMAVPDTDQAAEKSAAVPEWVKNTAGWWAEGLTSDAEFIGAMQHLAGAGIISIEQQDPVMAKLEAELAECALFTKAYMRLDCEDEVEKKITRHEYEKTATPYTVGPVTYYYPGAELEITPSGQPLLTIRMLAVNEGTDNTTLSCTGPAICNYDITDGTSAFKYASTDFTSGSITIKPDDSREFEMVFGPNIGYGGTTFVYDPEKEYHFRISEPFGSASIPLDLN